jgi:hypothetical protein
MSYQYRQYERYNERPRRSPLRCLFVSLTILVWVVLLGVLLLRFVVRPMITNMIEQRVAESVEVARPQSDVVVPVPGSGLLPTLPVGSFSVSDADANAWLAAHRDQLQGIDDVRLRFAGNEA